MTQDIRNDIEATFRSNIGYIAIIL